MFGQTCQMALSVITFFISVLMSFVASEDMEDCPEECRCSGTRVNCSTPFDGALLQSTLEALSPKTTVLSIVYSASVLQAYLFMKFSSLRKLEIRGDKSFTKLHKDSFSGLYNLRKLVITNTSITSLPADIVMPLIKLKQVDLSRNNLINLIDNSFHWSSENISFMDLSHNGIATLPHGLFRHVTNLQTLHLGHNNLGKFDVDFSRAWKLQELFFDNANLTHISDKTFIGLSGLNILVLKDNPWLVEISQNAFEPLANLQTLNLANNIRLKLISAMFQGMARLTHLQLNSGFKNKNFPNRIFSGLASLKTLDLSYTNLSAITQDDLEPCAMTLQNLNLSHTGIRILSNNTFSDCLHLKELNLSNASKDMRTFELNAFSGLSNLTTLDVSLNNLQTLSTQFIEILKPLKGATIFAKSDNLTCNCDILPFVRWLVTNAVDMRIKCLRPSWVYKHIVKTLSAQSLRCVKPAGHGNTLVVDEDVVGTTVTVSCIGYGYHDYPNVSYMVTTGNPVVEDKTDKLRNQRIDDNLNQYVTNLTFKIHGFKPENSGSIDCSASNEYGNTTWEMKIKYQDKRSPKAIIVPWAIVVIVLAIVVTVTVVVCWCIRRSKEPDDLNEDDDEDDFSPSDEF